MRSGKEITKQQYIIVLCMCVLACTSALPAEKPTSPSGRTLSHSLMDVEHVVIFMQENRNLVPDPYPALILTLTGLTTTTMGNSRAAEASLIVLPQTLPLTSPSGTSTPTPHR